jgi:Bacterial Ig-like domain (group 2)/Galactose oxidase, central domain/IPT/TIG domain
VFASGGNSNGAGFTVVAAPSITSLSITTGAPGAAVTVTGTNFGSSQGSGAVTFNGTTASVTTWTATSVAVTVPTGATTGNVVVFASGVNSNGKSFTVVADPNISSLSITSGSPGAPVTVAGTGFGSTQGSGNVTFNGTTASITTWTATSIAVTVPTAATSGNVVVFASGANSNGVNFTVVTLTSITVNLPNLSLPVNSPQQYTATGNYSNGTQQNLTASATWTSSSPSVATISATGLATAVAPGQTTIQATAGGINGSTLLTVTGPVFLQVGNLGTARYGHTATLLANGMVLIVGGENNSGQMLASAELYDPATDTFSPTGSLNNARTEHTATLLPDGTVLIAGGFYITPQSQYESLSSAEIYNPVAGTFSYANGTMNEGRYNATATMLNDGQVLIAGGNYYPPGGGVTASDSEIYDPPTQTFTVTAGTMVTPRENHTATLLNDGTVLIVGGDSEDGTALVAAAEIYNPVANTFSATGSLNTPTEFHASALMSTGEVLIAGGYCGGNCTPDAVARTEIYNPATQLFTYSTSLAIPRIAPTGTVLNNGTVLIAGGLTNTTYTGTAEIFDPTTSNVTGAGSMVTPRDSHTATLLSDGTVLFAAGSGAGGALLSAELYAPTPPPPFSLQVTPSAVNMQVGGTQQFSVVSNIGYPLTNATWTVSNQSLASISSDSSPFLTALASGQVTITATIDGVSAQAQITIWPSGGLAPGTPIWSGSSVPGFLPQQLIKGIGANGAEPDLYLTQSSSDGTESFVQAFTIDGQQMWQVQVPPVNANSSPDANGGMLVVENQTCNPGQTDPMTIVDLDPTSGQGIWLITAQGVPGAGPGGGTLYCYPEAPQMAILPDSSVAIAASGNTSGLPEFMIVNGQSGEVENAPNIPPSSYEGNLGGFVGGYSPIGAPIVDPDGNVYVEYEVRQIAYPPEVVSATLYLMEVASTGPMTSTQLSSTTLDENLFPGPIVPDGQGGVLATWSIAPGTAPMPTNPYQAADVVSGAIAVAYSLPFTPESLSFGPDGLPVNPSLAHVCPRRRHNSG